MKPAVLALIGVTLLCVTSGLAQEIELASFPSANGVRFVGNNPNSFPSETATSAGDFNGDGYDDLLFGSPLQNPDNSVYLAFGRADLNTDLNLTTFISSATSTGFRIWSSTISVGFDVSPAGDFNGDGYDDLLLMSWSGVAYLVYGHAGPPANINLDQQSGSIVKFNGTGTSGAGIGDFNGDGFDDIALGKYNYQPPGSYNDNSGRVWVIFGRDGLSGEVDLATFAASDENGFMMTGRYDSEFGGTLYSISDFNGDGFSDFAVAGRSAQPTMSYSRLIFLGKSAGFQDINFRDFPDYTVLPDHCVVIKDGNFGTGSMFITGCAANARMDFNGDGLSDILIGNIDEYGSTTLNSFVVFGRDDVTTSIMLADIVAGSTDGLQILSPPDQNVGETTGWAGDVNNDGFSDIVLTSALISNNEIAQSGCAYLIWGGVQTTGTMNLASFVTEQDGFTINGEFSNTTSPFINTSPAGDVNADGYDDFLLAITGYDENIHNSFGRNYLIKGREAEARVVDWVLWEQ